MKSNIKVSEITINYKPKVKASELPKISCSKDAVSYLRSIWSDKLEHVEEVYILLLNRNSKVLGYNKISQGGISSTIVDPKIVFQTALKANASGIILAHNHPSGSISPSLEDKAITKKIMEGGKVLEIQLFDHIILTAHEYLSFMDECEM